MTGAPVEAVAEDDICLGPLANSLGFLLRMAQIEVFERFHADLGGLGLRPGEFSVLWLLGRHPGVRQGLLAERLRIKRAHMAKLVRGLEERGLVSRSKPERDRRAQELRLTPEGRRFVDAHEARVLGYLSPAETPLTAAEHATLVRLLGRFTGIVP